MKVSELTALRIENTALKMESLQSKAALIYAEQARVIEEARAEVAASADALYNTDTREFQAPPALTTVPE